MAVANLIDEAPKVLTLSTTCHEFGTGNILAAGMSPVYYQHSVGYAYAGSTLIGSTAYTVASSILDSLGDPSGGRSIPRLREIADSVSRITSELGRSYHRNTGSTPPVDILVFGYCNVEEELQVFRLRSAGDHRDPARLDVELQISETSDHGDVCVIGSHAHQINNDIAALRANYDDDTRAWWRAPLEVLRRVTADETHPSIGGSIQLVSASHSGAHLYQIVLPVAGRAPQATMTLFGLDMHEHVPSVGPCRVVRPAFASGFPYEGFD